MNKQYTLAVLLLFVVMHLANAQYTGKTFGQIDLKEFDTQPSALMEGAEAVVLFDVGKSYFTRNNDLFDVVFERTTRIKILSEAGIKWATAAIPYYQEGGVFERVYEIVAIAYNLENGTIKKTNLDALHTYDEKINNSWTVKKFAIPNVKVGTIVEYKYRVISQYLFNLRDWQFQWKIPVLHSEYEVKMVPFFEYSWFLQGANKFDFHHSYEETALPQRIGTIIYQNIVHQYIMKNIPAFDDEEFITSINDYIIKLDFQLSKINYLNGHSTNVITTWKELIKSLQENKEFGGYIKKSEKIAPELIAKEKFTTTTEQAKFDFALNYVKQNFKWNGTEDKYASKLPNKFVDEKHGNSADINLFTIGLLNAMGIKALPVILSTRKNGKLNYDYPHEKLFNYVIILATVNGSNILTDATELLNLNNRIPFRCINDKGLVINKEKVDWVALENHLPSVTRTEMLIDMVDDHTANISIAKTATEYDALFYRNECLDNMKSVKQRLANSGYLLIDSSVAVQNLTEKAKPFILNYKLTGETEMVNNKIYCAPFLNLIITDNPLKQKKRTYPIDMTYPKQRLYNTTISLPDGYKIDHLPPAQNINNELFELSYSASSDGKKISVQFSYFFKKSVYSSNDYTTIKSYFNEIIATGNEKIVLSKK